MLLRRILILVVVLLVWPAARAAGDVTQAIFFGDSLTDVGNVSQATFGLYPGPYYFNGRVSNGPVYAEHFYSDLGFGTLTRSLAGGNDFAYAGARTTGTGGFDGLFIRDLDEQVTTYLGSRTPDADTLFLVFIGANDLVHQLGGGSGTPAGSVDTLMAQIDRLRIAGATQFMFPNLPDLGLTPRYNGSPASAAAAQAASLAFNAALAAALDDLEAADPSLALFRMDVFAAFNQIVADPAAFGLVNVTDPAAPGLEVGASSYDTGLIVPNPHEYLFWDELHPTAAGHLLLGEFAMASVPEPAALLITLAAGFIVMARRRVAS